VLEDFEEEAPIQLVLCEFSEANVLQVEKEMMTLK